MQSKISSNPIFLHHILKGAIQNELNNFAPGI